jgi:hypothetical protein
MSYLVLALFFGAIIHFVYQSIIAPSLRMDLRASLLQLGRELSDIERGSAEQANQRCFSDLCESHKRLLEALDRISVVALLEVERELRDNPRVRKQVEARSASFDHCELAGLRSLRARTIRMAVQAVAINNGGLIFSILPLMPFLLASAKFRKWLLRLTVQAIDFHQQLGPAYVRVKHDVPGL